MMFENEKKIVELVKAALGEVVIHEIDTRKNNDTSYRGISLRRPENTVGFTVYWRDVEEKCGKDFSEDAAVGYIVELAQVHLNAVIQKEDILDWDKAKKAIHKKVVNYEKNRGRLAMFVYRRYLDLAEVYYLKIDLQDGRKGTAEIPLAMLEQWGVKEEEVNSWAVRNMESEDYSIASLDEVIESFGIPVSQKEVPFYLITNEEKAYGAAVITNQELLGCLLEDIPSNCYILPSSLHEILVYPRNDLADAKALEDMVREVNRTVVDEKEVLSDHIYFWEKEARKLSIYQET